MNGGVRGAFVDLHAALSAHKIGETLLTPLYPKP